MREYNHSTWMIFVDFKTAYNSAEEEDLFKAVQELDVQNLIRIPEEFRKTN